MPEAKLLLGTLTVERHSLMVSGDLDQQECRHTRILAPPPLFFQAIFYIKLFIYLPWRDCHCQPHRHGLSLQPTQL